MAREGLVHFAILAFCLAFLLCACQAPYVAQKSVSKSPSNFSQSKSILQQAYKEQNFTQEFYCAVEFIPDTLRVIPSNKYTPRNPITKANKQNIRAKRIEFEHIMPAHRFGKNLSCWQNGGRKACANDNDFRQMEADMRNIVPAIGEINADRSNFSFDEPPKDIFYMQYGDCKVYTDFKAKKFYPQAQSRGIIARIYLYMSEHYHIELSKEEESLMRKWDKLYPPSAYEKKLLQTQGVLP